MNWLYWLLMLYFAIGAVLTVAMIGKPRPPVTPASAAWTVVIHLALIALVSIGWPR